MTEAVSGSRSGTQRSQGVSARDAIFTRDKLTLYRYRPIAPSHNGPPLLIVYALVNRPHMMDLQPDRSLIRGLLSEGMDVYLIDWGYPDGADRFVTLADYIDGHLRACVLHVLASTRFDSLNLLGVCQGGVLSLCYSALHPQTVRNLVTMVTPVDFQTPDDLLSRWVRGIDLEALVDDGNVSGDLLNQLFLSLMPFRLTQQKYVQFMTEASDPAKLENFMRVEQWVFDSPDQAGTAFREFVRWCYQENRLLQGQLQIAGRRVELSTIRQPVLNLIGTRDHLVPPAASRALQGALGSSDYTALEFDLGHIGMYVSGRAQRTVPPAIAQWLSQR